MSICPKVASRKCMTSAVLVMQKTDEASSYAGSFCYAFPDIIERIHPHRRGDPEILDSIRMGSLLLCGIGLLYTTIGSLNLQVTI
jgi:hypothetical protein